MIKRKFSVTFSLRGKNKAKTIEAETAFDASQILKKEYPVAEIIDSVEEQSKRPAHNNTVRLTRSLVAKNALLADVDAPIYIRSSRDDKHPPTYSKRNKRKEQL